MQKIVRIHVECVDTWGLWITNFTVYLVTHDKHIIFHIFTFMRRGTRAVCKLVCKDWRTIASEAFFGYVHITLLVSLISWLADG